MLGSNSDLNLTAPVEFKVRTFIYFYSKLP